VFDHAAAALHGEFIFAAVADADAASAAKPRISVERSAAWLGSLDGAGLSASAAYEEALSVDALTKVC
jgi:hypothetical protein